MGQEAFSFDPEAMQSWLMETGLAAGPVTITRIGEGHSNLTYLLQDGATRLVLRTPPPPPWPPRGHDVIREARTLDALGRRGIPVPRVHEMVEAGEVADVPFFVMEYLDGDVCTTRLPERLDNPDERRSVGEALVDVLIALERIDWQDDELRFLGRPDGFLERMLDRLPNLIAPEEGSLPGPFVELQDELRRRRPPQVPPGVVHGDLRLGNVMLSREAPARILGVLDWEFSAVGDPLSDLGYLLGTMAVAGEPANSVSAMSAATRGDGFPTRAQLAERYAAGTGRSTQDIGWYQALALFKLAVIFEYNRRKATPDSDPFWLQPDLVDSVLDATRATLDLGVHVLTPEVRR